MGELTSERREMQEAGLRLLAATGQPRIADPFYLYTSGEVGPYFINAEQPARHEETKQEAYTLMRRLVRLWGDPSQWSGISGGETRDWDYSEQVAVRLGLEHTWLYKDGRINAGENQEHGIAPGPNTFHIADLNRSGSSFFNKVIGGNLHARGWTETVAGYGGRIAAAAFFVDRLEGGAEKLLGVGIPSKAVVPFDEVAFQYMRDQGLMGDDKYRSVCQFLEDPEGWGREALFGNLDHFVTLIGTQKPEKVAKTIDRYGREEVLDRLTTAGYDTGALQ